MSVLTQIYIYVISLMPHYVGLSKPGIPLMSVSRFYIVIWIAFFCFNYITNFKYNGNYRNNVEYERYPFTIPFVVLFVSLLLVSIFSNSFAVSFQAWVAMLLEVLIPSYLIWISFDNSKDIIKVFKMITLIFIPIAIYGTLAEIQSFNPVIDFIQSRFDDDTRTLVISYENFMRLGIYGRAQSIFYHPLQYGCFLCFMLIILFQFNKNKLAFNKKTIVIIALIFLYSLLLVRSRSPMVFLLFAGFVYLCFQKSIKTIVMVAFAAMPIVIFFIFGDFQNSTFDNTFVRLIVSIFQEALGQESFVRGSSFIERLYKYYATLDIFFIHPLLGHGLGSMRDMVYSKNFGIGGAESFIFEVLIETGLVGMLAYVFFYAFILKYFRNIIKLSTDLVSTKFSIITIALIVGYLSFICVTGRMRTFNYFMMIATLSAKYLSCKSREHSLSKLEVFPPSSDAAERK